MSKLKVSAIKDLTGNNGIMLAGGTITATTTLSVSDITINGTITGGSPYIVPAQRGNEGKALRSTGSGFAWSSVSAGSGIKSMQVWTSNGTWNKPAQVGSILSLIHI